MINIDSYTNTEIKDLPICDKCSLPVEPINDLYYFGVILLAQPEIKPMPDNMSLQGSIEIYHHRHLMPTHKCIGTPAISRYLMINSTGGEPCFKAVYRLLREWCMGEWL